MDAYDLSLDAEHDLLEIAGYTLENWGLAQSDKYEAALIHHFEGLATRRPECHPLELPGYRSHPHQD